MATADAAPAKTCVHCKQDCSNRPRVRDVDGRYACKPCHEAALKRAAAARASEPAAAAAAVAPPAEDLSLEAEGDTDAGFALAPDFLPIAPTIRACPECSFALPADAVLCVRCGHNLKTGTKLSTGTTAPKAQPGHRVVVTKNIKKCGNCGYSLAGLEIPKCPECGAFNRKPTDNEIREEESRAVARAAWRKPILMFLGGTAGLMILRAAQGHADLIVFDLLRYVILVPIGLVVYVLCCLAWIGFDAPLSRVAVGLAGVYAITGLVSGFLAYIPFGFIGPFAALVMIYAYLLADALDLEWVDAALMALAQSFVQIVITMFIMAAMQQ